MKKKEFLKNYIEMADSHVLRINEALVVISNFAPLNPDNFTKLSIDKIALLDLISTRFSKLQDLIGAKIFPLILSIKGEDADSLLDRLNRLEKIGFLSSSPWWMELRELRNQIAHDYPNEVNQICNHFNLLLKKLAELLSFWQDLKAKIQNI